MLKSKFSNLIIDDKINMSALLPVVSHYSPSAAATLRANSFIRNTVSVPSGFVSAKASLEVVYPAMGITCSEVGGLTTPSGSSTYVYGMEPCIDDISGYAPTNNVGEHLSLDLDQKNLNSAVSNSDLTLAYQQYSVGMIIILNLCLSLQKSYFHSVFTSILLSFFFSSILYNRW